jgi:hypothetical protein
MCFMLLNRPLLFYTLDLFLADFVYAAELVEKEGRFTGKLKGMAASNTEKADRMQEYARVHGVSLADSLAFGDSIADLPMLEIVSYITIEHIMQRMTPPAFRNSLTLKSCKVSPKKDCPMEEPTFCFGVCYQAGQPHAVNPDSRLKAIATKRGWPILQWSTQPKETSQYAAAV